MWRVVSQTLWPPYIRERAHDIHHIKVWVGPRADSDVEAKRKAPVLAENRILVVQYIPRWGGKGFIFYVF
jgi:hypothetical protein